LIKKKKKKENKSYSLAYPKGKKERRGDEEEGQVVKCL